MGVNIHLHIIYNGKTLKKDIFDGRNSDWFDNMSGRCVSEPAYEELPFEYDWNCDDTCPEDLKEEYLGIDKGLNHRWTYNERAIRVDDFKEWYKKYKPYLKAGYVSRHDAWLYEKKNIIPSPDTVERVLWESDDAEEYIVDKVWLEFEDKYEPSTWLYKYLTRNKISNKAWIVYCFDN